MLPYYGDVELMKQAVRSVLAQRNPDWRLVVVDDCYPDPEAGRWLAELADPRVEYLRNESQLGVNGNFRRCVELVRAPYFQMLGGDDVLEPNYVDVVLAVFAQHPDAAVVSPGVHVIDDSGAVVRPLGDRIKSMLAPSAEKSTVLVGETLAVGLLHGNWTYFPSLAWRTEVVAPISFRPGLEVALDLALLLDLARAGGVLVLAPEVAFRYRRHTESVSSVRAVDGRRFDEERDFFAEEAAAFSAHGWPRAARAARGHLTSRLNAIVTIPAALAGRQWPAARRLVRHALG
ncbi:glycosyltransferase family 2 protein [Tomitella biformata]|uniref:glycosyltransferase family 2 protein n=1 Tax=Tomitella biformata TaxID=630403 RepID=UPI0005706836|nr:glycosyltransferase [Tomitella biformata]